MKAIYITCHCYAKLKTSYTHKITFLKDLPDVHHTWAFQYSRLVTDVHVLHVLPDK